MFMAELSTPSVCLGKILIQVSVPVLSFKEDLSIVACACACVTPGFLSTLHFFFLFHSMLNMFPLIPSMHLVHARRLLLTVSHIKQHCQKHQSLIGNTVCFDAHCRSCNSPVFVLGLCGCIYMFLCLDKSCPSIVFCLSPIRRSHSC